jgi:hypothetical protein
MPISSVSSCCKGIRKREKMAWVRRLVRQKIELYIYSFDAFKKQQLASPIRVYPKIVHWLTGRGLSLRLHLSISLGKEWLRHFGDACLIKVQQSAHFIRDIDRPPIVISIVPLSMDAEDLPIPQWPHSGVHYRTFNLQASLSGLGEVGCF